MKKGEMVYEYGTYYVDDDASTTTKKYAYDARK
jgi:hypothetical protein